MGVWAPFFGRPAYTMTLAARLVQQTGAALLLIWGERLPRGARLRRARRRPSTRRCRRGDERSGRIRRGHQPGDGAPDPAVPAAVPVGLRPLQGAAQRRSGRRRDGCNARTDRWALVCCSRCCGCCTGCRCRCWPRSAAASARCCMRWPARAARIALRNLELCLPEMPRGRARSAGARALPLARPQHPRARAAVVRVAGAAEAADPRRRRRGARRAQRAAGDVAGAALHGARRGRRGDAAVPAAARSRRSTRSRATR